MRTVVASSDEKVTGWLRGVLSSAGLSVAVVAEPSPDAPELWGADLLIADSTAADVLAGSGPERRVLVLPRGAVVDVSRAMASGFMDLIVVPAPEDEVLGRIGRALDTLVKPLKPSPTEQRTRAGELKAVVGRVCRALAGLGPEGHRMGHELAHGMLSVFLLLIDAHEATERAAPGHSKRAATLVRAMAPSLGLSPSECSWLELAARLQDIGMLPLRLPLGDAAPLSMELRRSLVEHPRLSAEILAPLEAYGLPVQAVRAHHERCDGSGYPDGLSDADVRLDAQVLAAADVFEALTSPRPWRPAESVEDALEAMQTTGAFRPRVMRSLREAVEAGGTARPTVVVVGEALART